MQTVMGADGPIETLVTGSGPPTTVFAHGLAGSIAETRPFGSGVAGSRVFLHFRGHGGTAGPAARWTYDALADELSAVASAYAAKQALGVSLGAGVLLRVAAARPDAFERLVLVLPAVIDCVRAGPGSDVLHRQADLVESGDVAALAASIVDGQPPPVRERSDVALWARRRAVRLAGTAVARALRELAEEHPLTDRGGLARLDIPVLVIGQEADEAHPVAVARELADLLPRAELAIFDDGAVMWSHRREVRDLVSGFLNR